MSDLLARVLASYPALTDRQADIVGEDLPLNAIRAHVLENPERYWLEIGHGAPIQCWQERCRCCRGFRVVDAAGRVLLSAGLSGYHFSRRYGGR